MNTHFKFIIGSQSIALAVLLIASCGSLERDNPADPGVAPQRLSGNTLSLVVPLPKPLVSVIDSLVAVLSGPGMTPIVKQLDHSPRGPATLTMGAVSPGTERTLTIEGYDHDGVLILEGERRNISIIAGDTTSITINLNLLEGVNEPEPDPEPDPDTDTPTEGDPPADDTEEQGS
jgi:hypothetical protein